MARLRHPQSLVDRDPAALLRRETELVQERMRADTGGPDHGARQDLVAVGEPCGVWLHLLEGRLGADVDAASGEQLGGVVAEPGRNLGKDLRRSVHQHPLLGRVAEVRVVAECVPNEVGELRQRLDARVPGSHEHERELPPAVGGIGVRSGDLEPAQDVVSQMDRVGKRLEPEGVLGEPRDRQRPDDRAERDDEVRVADPEDSLAGLHLHPPALGVVGFRLSEEQLGVRTHLPERNDDVAWLQRP